MTKYLPALLLFAATLTGCATSGPTQSNGIIRAKEKVAPALVHVRPVIEVFRRGERQEVAITGSGFIITPDGYVVTNNHVAGKSQYVTCILFDKDEVSAQVVGSDPYTDIAILKLDTDRTDLPYVKLGSSGELEAGQTVIALGSPHGLSRSVSAGIVSVTDRNLESLGASQAPYNNWIQTDAAINPGNSGGPLVNLRGEVIGINTRKLSGADNVGFAIPMDIAKQVIDDIVADGHVTRSTIGVAFQHMMRYTDDPSRKGVLIGDVDPLSPAYSARIRPGDILLGINGVPTDARFTEDLPAVRKLVADLPVGESVKLNILRGEKQMDIHVATIEKSEFEGAQREFSEWGCTISELTPAVIRRAQLATKQGVVATGVQVGGIAHQSGLSRGDVILTVNNEPVHDLADFQEKYASFVEAEEPMVLLTAKRGALTRYVLIKQEFKTDTTANEGDSPSAE